MYYHFLRMIWTALQNREDFVLLTDSDGTHQIQVVKGRTILKPYSNAKLLEVVTRDSGAQVVFVDPKGRQERRRRQGTPGGPVRGDGQVPGQVGRACAEDQGPAGRDQEDKKAK